MIKDQAQFIASKYGINFNKNQVGETIQCIDEKGNWFKLERFNSSPWFIGASSTTKIVLDFNGFNKKEVMQND